VFNCKTEKDLEAAFESIRAEAQRLGRFEVNLIVVGTKTTGDQRAAVNLLCRQIHDILPEYSENDWKQLLTAAYFQYVALEASAGPSLDGLAWEVLLTRKALLSDRATASGLIDFIQAWAVEQDLDIPGIKRQPS
jgi:hypothetical protein